MGGDQSGGVVDRRSVGRAGLALDVRGGDDWLGDGARAVSDGQSGGLGDGVGLVAVGDGGGLRAVGGVLSHDLGGVRDVSSGVVSHGAGGGSEDDGSGELHFD